MRILVLSLLSALIFFQAIAKNDNPSRAGTNSDNVYKMPPADLLQAAALYDSMQLGKAGLERDIFYKAYKGYLVLNGKKRVHNRKILSIADLSQSSRNKRLYIIDLENVKLILNTFVSHGKNSGGEMATSFSNKTDSYKSTLGFLITAETYTGTAGYSLRFDGMEPKINDQVWSRGIIVHGSDFVNAEMAHYAGKVGNSLGCPAVPKSQCKSIINTIKGGSVFFIYSPDEFYNSSSPILNASLNQQNPYAAIIND